MSDDNKIEDVKPIKPNKPVSFLEWLKRYDNFDKYVLFLLGLGFNVSETAELIKVTRQHVYDVIGRNRHMIDHYSASLGEAVQKAVEKEQGD